MIFSLQINDKRNALFLFLWAVPHQPWSVTHTQTTCGTWLNEQIWLLSEWKFISDFPSISPSNRIWTTQVWRQCEPLSLHYTCAYVKHLWIGIHYYKKCCCQCEIQDIVGVDSSGEAEVETESITHCTMTHSNFSKWAISQVNPLQSYLAKTNFPIIISCCAPYNLGQKHRTAKAHMEVLEQFLHFGIQSYSCLYLAS